LKQRETGDIAAWTSEARDKSGPHVDSLARPGGNLTGMSYLAFDLVGKRIELLKEWVPQVRHVAVLARPQHPGEHRERQATQEIIDNPKIRSEFETKAFATVIGGTSEEFGTFLRIQQKFWREVLEASGVRPN
jgi:ABC transporter substrate binding protein